jgi:hypothetical protein
MMLDRRELLAAGLVAAAAPFASPIISADDAPGRRLKVVAIFTEFTYRSHAHVDPGKLP